jgi:hypothetical protein
MSLRDPESASRRIEGRGNLVFQRDCFVSAIRQLAEADPRNYTIVSGLSMGNRVHSLRILL